MNPRKRVPRGNALMLTLIAIAVLMVLVVGAIQFTNYNREATAEKLRGDRIDTCAESARRHLLSRLRLFRMAGQVQLVEGLRFRTELIDDPDPTERSTMMAGHYGDPLPQITAVEVSATAMGAAGRQVRDISNAAPLSGSLGGKFFRVVMKCQEPGPVGQPRRESEVEFLFRYQAM
jgi:hypothetical protein